MPGKSRRSAPDRFALFLALLALSLVVIAGRLVWIQGVSASEYAVMAAKQRTREMVVTPKRGVVYDREGEPVAISSEARTVYAVPSLIPDPSAAATQLAGVLGGDPADYERRLRRKSSFSYVARKVELERAKRVEALKIPGIEFLEDSRRTYPSGELACQVLGFVGVDDKGLAGLEQHYDSLLAGIPGSVLAERDPHGGPIVGGVKHTVDKVDGRDIVLTIDKDIQYQAQLELGATVREFAASYGSVVVMDPRNGEVLAMASTPSYDPNDLKTAKGKALTNRPVSLPYEPGSTIKPFVAAAALDKGLYTPDSKFDLPSTIKVGGHVIHESHDRPNIEYTLREIIANSSNVGAVRIGMALGKQTIYDYYTRFGFDAKTGVDFPGESAGVVPAPSTWSASSIGNIPFGQGMTATPLQIARAYSAIACGGELVTPHLLLSVPGSETPVWPKRRVLSAKAAREMSGVLQSVVTEGTGGSAKVEGYEVAGKTGTAQVAKGGSYASGAYVASFAGYLPVDDPRVLIIVVIEEPTKGEYGGAVAAPMFSRLGRFAVDHLKIPPSAMTTPAPSPEASSATTASGQ